MSEDQMRIIMDRIMEAVRDCGRIMLSADRTPSMVEEKSGHANFVTYYDKKVQQILCSRLAEIFPEARFMGEEEEDHTDVSHGYAFIVDPIDGTTNFIKDYKVSTISVGLILDEQPYAGVIYNPYLDEMFSAVRGQGAFCNGQPVHVSGNPLEKGILLLGTSPYHEDLWEETFRIAYRLFHRALDLRRSGSAAWDLCCIAAGRAEVYFECILQPWDYAAGAAILLEAGGSLTTLEGNPVTMTIPCSILATNGVSDVAGFLRGDERQ